MTEAASAKEVVILDREDLEFAQHAAREQGVEVQVLTPTGFEPVSTVTLILMGSTLAVATLARILDQRKGGQVIDLRPGAPKPFYRTRDVLYGLVVVVSQDGQVLVHVKQPEDLFTEVVANLRTMSAEIGEAGSGTVSEQVREIVGNKARVEHRALIAPSEKVDGDGAV
ncbi:MAG TPA: hypothetical protein VK988_02340 [Acidimicrobiales bacterium]|nr:hypothetical protein [Acidimicrobiales bacterium]